MSNLSIAELTNAKISYHIEVFDGDTRDTNSCVGAYWVGGVCFVGLTFLVLGILGHLNIIPKTHYAGMSAMIGIGSIILISEFLALVVLAGIALKKQVVMRAILNDQSQRSPKWWTDRFDITLHRDTQKPLFTVFAYDGTQMGLGKLYGVMIKKQEERLIHLFNNGESCKKMERDLRAKNYHYQSWGSSANNSIFSHIPFGNDTDL